MSEQTKQLTVEEVISITDKPSQHFRSKEELGGAIDPRINTKGQPPNRRPHDMTRRSNHQSELVSLLRKLKPHLSAAVIRTSSIVSNPKSKDSDAVAAARLLMSTYQSLMNDLYKDSDKDAQDVPMIQDMPKFRLTVQENN